jgi:hypothetical protein
MHHELVDPQIGRNGDTNDIIDLNRSLQLILSSEIVKEIGSNDQSALVTPPVVAEFLNIIGDANNSGV